MLLAPFLPYRTHSITVMYSHYGEIGDLSGIEKVHTDFLKRSKTKHTICNAIWGFRLCTIINKY